jgi:hypothetical protein
MAKVIEKFGATQIFTKRHLHKVHIGSKNIWLKKRRLPLIALKEMSLEKLDYKNSKRCLG